MCPDYTQMVKDRFLWDYTGNNLKSSGASRGRGKKTSGIFAGRTNQDERESDTYMGGNEKDGYYCSICGGIPPDKITTKRVLIDGKETGIDHLDWIFGEVAKLAVDTDDAVTDEILKRVKQFNYVPTKKTAEYGAGLLAAYKKFRAGDQ
jgi:hypothetical protein